MLEYVRKEVLPNTRAPLLDWQVRSEAIHDSSSNSNNTVNNSSNTNNNHNHNHNLLPHARKLRLCNACVVCVSPLLMYSDCNCGAE